MPIAHSECLYYPDMVVDDVSPDILARLVVCWENIWTIVPEGMTRPSKSRADRELEELGVLKSFPIAPYSKAVRLAGEAVQKAFDHGSLKKILSDPRENYRKLYDAKLGDQIRSALNWGKLPSEFADCVAGSANTKYWKVSQKFASAYMAVLAKYVADH